MTLLPFQQCINYFQMTHSVQKKEIIFTHSSGADLTHLKGVVIMMSSPITLTWSRGDL